MFAQLIYSFPCLSIPGKIPLWWGCAVGDMRSKQQEALKKLADGLGFALDDAEQAGLGLIVLPIVPSTVEDILVLVRTLAVVKLREMGVDY